MDSQERAKKFFLLWGIFKYGSGIWIQILVFHSAFIYCDPAILYSTLCIKNITVNCVGHSLYSYSDLLDKREYRYREI